MVSLSTNHNFIFRMCTMKRITDLVNNQLIRSIKSYDKLSDSVYEMLHLNKEKHNVWVVIKQQQLTIMTDNPYLGTQLRYQQDNIRDNLNRLYLLELKKSKVKIVPPRAKNEKAKKERFIINEKTGRVLKSIANDIEDDELRESLIKLAVKDKEIYKN